MFQVWLQSLLVHIKYNLSFNYVKPFVLTCLNVWNRPSTRKNLSFDKAIRSICVLLECKNCVNVASYSYMFSFVWFKDFYYMFSILKFTKLCHFIPFFAHESQYFSISIAPSTLNNASWVAMFPQFTQNFAFPPTSSNDLSKEKFSI